MDLNTLHMLVRVADAGSLSAAARRAGVPKSTLSRKLKELEDELGVRIFQRHSRALGLTAPGRLLLDRARRICEEIDTTARDVRSHGARVQGRLRVTASVSLGERYLAPIVIQFLARYPDVRLELLLDAAAVDLVASEIDVAIRIGRPDPQGALIARRIDECRLYLCAAPRLIEAHAPITEIDDLRGVPCVAYHPGGQASSWLLEGPDGQPVSVAVAPRLVANSHPVARDAVLAGIGVGLLPGPYCAEDLRSGRLRRVLAPHRSPAFWLYAAFQSRDHVPAAVRAFVDFVATELRLPDLSLDE